MLTSHFHPILGEGPPSGSFAVWTFEVPFDVEFEGMQLTKGDILHGLLTK